MVNARTLGEIVKRASTGAAEVVVNIDGVEAPVKAAVVEKTQIPGRPRIVLYVASQAAVEAPVAAPAIEPEVFTVEEIAEIEAATEELKAAPAPKKKGSK